MTPSKESNVLPKDGNGDDDGMDDMGFGSDGGGGHFLQHNKDFGLSSAVDS